MAQNWFKWLVPALILALAGCVAPFRSEVARFHQLPAPQGQTFVILAADPDKAGGLEFSQYASLVRQQLIAQGYQPATDTQSASLVVEMDYGVNDGRERIATRPGFNRWGGYYDPFWGSWYGRYGWYYPGYYDSFWGPWGYGYWDQPEVYSYTVYSSFLDMRIKRAATGESVFEGHAEAQTRSRDLTTLVPNLVKAMFDNFPGRSGEKVIVKIQDEKKR